MKRFGVELLIILILVLVAAGIWIWKDREISHAIVEEQEVARQQVAAVVDSGEVWADALAASEARTAFRAFAAGIHPILMGDVRTQDLDPSIGALLELPAITFVHVLGPEGTVMASSDRKLQTTGQAPPSGAWVTATTDVTERAGENPGTVELAAPVLGPAGPFAFLWIGYDVEKLRESTRPAAWPTGPMPAPAEPAPAETGQ